jgi:hypothetical protein
MTWFGDGIGLRTCDAAEVDVGFKVGMDLILIDFNLP